MLGGVSVSCDNKNNIEGFKWGWPKCSKCWKIWLKISLKPHMGEKEVNCFSINHLDT